VGERSPRLLACCEPAARASTNGWRASAPLWIPAPCRTIGAATIPRCGRTNSKRCSPRAWKTLPIALVTKRSNGRRHSCGSTCLCGAARGPHCAPSGDSCTSKATSGNDRATCLLPTPRQRKKRQIRRELAHLSPHGANLFEDETDLLLFPPLRAAWGRRGQPLAVPISGGNARRVVFGTINIETGHRLFLARTRQRSEDFQAFLSVVARHYRGRTVALLLDEDPSHTARASQERAAALGIRLVWLPKRCPELNGMDHLWGHGKDHVCADRQYPDLDAEVERFIAFLSSLSNREALRQAGLLSRNSWLRL
jgi:hypothetical protein